MRTTLMILAVLLVGTAFSSTAAAQVDELEPSALAYAVAQISFNEDADNTDTLGLIWTITKGRSSTTRGRLRWLQCHSPRVLGHPDCRRQVKFCREGRNCWWTRNLDREGTQPEGWPHSDRWWRHITRRRWLVHLERTTWLVSGRKRHVNPCPDGVVPRTWGSEADSARMFERGYTRVTCGTSNNFGFIPPVRGDAS